MRKLINKYKNRLAHSIDLRIDAKTLTPIATIESLRERVEALEAELRQMHAGLGKLTTGLSDQQRASGELLEQVVRRIELIDRPQPAKS
jgi:hypothetical protein